MRDRWRLRAISSASYVRSGPITPPTVNVAVVSPRHGPAWRNASRQAGRRPCGGTALAGGGLIAMREIRNPPPRRAPTQSASAHSTPAHAMGPTMKALQHTARISVRTSPFDDADHQSHTRSRRRPCQHITEKAVRHSSDSCWLVETTHSSIRRPLSSLPSTTL